MPTLSYEALLPYSAGQIFELVNDVTAYPEFVPGCEAVALLPQTDGSTRVTLDLCLNIAGPRPWRGTVITENHSAAPENIRMRLANGALRALAGSWSFHELSQAACRVSLDLQFAFSSTALNSAISPLLGSAGDQMFRLIRQRAEAVYGR